MSKHLKGPKITSVPRGLNTRMMHLNNRKNEVWNVEHFMHSTVADLITSRRERGYQTPIINDKITLYNSYTTWLSA